MNFSRHDIEWTPEKIARFWDYYQSNQAINDLYFGAQCGLHVARVLNKHAGLSQAKNILDFSCGKGDLVGAILPYLRQDQKIWAMDVSPLSIKTTALRFSGNAHFGEAKHIAEFPVDFASGYFDLIVLTEVIEHLSADETESVIGEMHRLLAPEGRIMITTPNNENLARESTMCPDCGCVFHRWQHRQRWTKQSLESIFLKRRFTTKKIQTIRWGSTGMRRILFPLLTRVTPLERTGLYYIGKK